MTYKHSESLIEFLTEQESEGVPPTVWMGQYGGSISEPFDE